MAVAEKTLPHGELAQPPSMQVFAGISPSFSGPNARKAWLVWLIDEADHASNEYVVDAATGKIIEVVPKADFAINRMIYNAKETNKLPGTLARTEGGPKSEDANVNEAYDGLGYAYNFYRARFSTNGKAMTTKIRRSSRPSTLPKSSRPLRKCLLEQGKRLRLRQQLHQSDRRPRP